MLRFWNVAWVSIVLACQATAIGPPHRPSAADVARAIRDLGDDSFAVRERASRFLWSAGRAAEPALLAAKSSPDQEVASRSNAILDQFKWGLYPDTPGDVQKLIHEYQQNVSNEPNGGQSGTDPRNMGIIERLREHGRPGYRALYRIAVADPNGHSKIYRELLWAAHVECRKWLEAYVMEEMSGTSPGKASLAGTDRSLDGLAAALDWAPGTLVDWERESFAHQLIRAKAVVEMIRTDRSVQAPLRLDVPGSVTGPRAFEAAILARSVGQSALAAQLALRSADESLLKSMLLENRDWQTLWQKSQAAEHAGDATYTPLTSAERALPGTALGERAALASRVGETRLFESLIAQLKQFEAKDSSYKEEVTYRANALLGNDRPDDAIELLKKAGRSDGAIDLLLLRLRYREATELASRPDDPKTEQSWQLDLARANLWSTLGEPDRAGIYFQKAIVGITQLDQDKSIAQAEWVEAIVQAGRRDLLLAQAARWRLEDPNNLELLLGALFPDNDKDANVWWRVLRAVRPGDSLEITLKLIEDLLEGRATAAQVKSYVAGPALAKVRSSVPDEDLWRDVWLASASAYHAMGRNDLAQAAVATLDRAKCSQEQLIRLGDLAAGRQDWVSASRDYGDAWRKWPEHDDGESASEAYGMAALALHLQGNALAGSGQADLGNRLKELAHWLPLADERARRKLLGKLEERHEQEAACRERELLSRTGEPGSLDTWLGRHGLARSLTVKKNYRRAANLVEPVLLERMQWNFIQGFGRYLSDSSLWHRNLAQVHLQAGRVKECVQEAERAEAVAPADIDLAIALCPELSRSGQAAEAEGLYRRMFERHKKVSLEYPRSAELHNNLAWLAVRCHRNLDEALAHARRAVELSPEHPEFIDTLAEAQFQSGDRSQAIENARRCVRLDPHREYYKKQLTRMEKGDSSAEVPPTD
jgi:tetratricopeptide (TPR) repeat protein